MSNQAWMLVAVGTVLLIEILRGSHRGVHRQQDWKIIGLSLAGSWALRPLLALLTASVIGFALPRWQGSLAGAPFWPSFAVILLVAEFCQYWLHRWAHDTRKHPLLYGMHRTHHSAPYVNVTLMYRTNLFWVFVHSYTWVTAIAIYLGLTAAAGAFYLSIMFWNVITHSDWRWDDAIIARVPGGARLVQAFELVFVTPRIHHTHHGYGHDGKAYRNFCTMLSIWDRLFGTLHVPQGRPWRYGLPGGEHHWLRQMVFPLLPLGDAPKRDRRGRAIGAPVAPLCEPPIS